MSQELLSKHLGYIVSECRCHMENGEVSAPQLKKLKVELDRFKEQLNQFEVNEELKGNIQALAFNVSSKKEKRKRGFLKWIVSLSKGRDGTDVIEDIEAAERAQIVEWLVQDIETIKRKVKASN